MTSVFCQAEWASAFNIDPSGKNRTLIPVRISSIKPQGLLSSIVYIDLFGLNESMSRDRLLTGVSETITRKAVFPEICFDRPRFSGIISLLELYCVSSVSDLPIFDNWKKHPYHTDTFKIPIGCDANRNVQYQRIGISGDGYHGMVVGRAGSGKSEYLKTLIVSSAISYNPDILSFYYINFKGYMLNSDILSLPNIAKSFNDKQFSDFLLDLEQQIELRNNYFSSVRVNDIVSYNRISDIKPLNQIIVIIDDITSLYYANVDYLHRTLSCLASARTAGIWFLFSSERLEALGTLADRFYDYIVDFNNQNFSECNEASNESSNPDHCCAQPGMAMLSSKYNPSQRLIKIALSTCDRYTGKYVLSQIIERIHSEYDKFHK